jgi:hypothetical protein
MPYCQIINSQVVRGPCGLPARLRLPDGSTRTDLAALPAEDLRALGWWPCAETRPDLAGPTEGYGQPELTVDAEAGEVRAVYPVVAVKAPALAVPLSKLAVRRWLRARGLESALDGLLAADAQAARDWADAQALRLDDPLMQAAMPVFRQQAGLADADVAALVEAART